MNNIQNTQAAGISNQPINDAPQVGVVYGYARVSTTDQNSAMQIEALKAYGCTKIFTDDGVSGKLASRPQFDKLLKILKPGDTIVVWKLDRIGRSLVNLIDLMARFNQEGVQFKSLTNGEFDTTTAQGRLIFTFMAALAQYERELINERTSAGIDAAKRRGVKFGRKLALTQQQLQSVNAMLAGGSSPTEAAKAFGVHPTTVYRALSRQAA